jgi:predicted signal transduction protein with EAL and GGDEF domain
MTIVVEGIETPDQLERVTAEGCIEGQGYLFGRPVPAAEIRVILDQETDMSRLVAWGAPLYRNQRFFGGMTPFLSTKQP